MTSPTLWGLWRRLYLVPTLAWVVSGLILVLASRGAIEAPLREERRDVLAAEARAVAGALQSDPGRDGAALVGYLFETPLPGNRLVLIGPGNRILADTARDSTLWLARPREVVRVRRHWRLEPGLASDVALPEDPGGDGYGVRLIGETLRAAPVDAGSAADPESGTLRLVWIRSFEDRGIASGGAAFGLVIAWLLLGGALVAAGVSGAGRVSRGLSGLRRTIESIAGRHGATGALSRPATPFDLAYDLERVRRWIDREAAEVRAESRQREAVLRGMAEGVLAVDMRSRVVLMNPAAARALSLAAPLTSGARFPEHVASSELQRFVQESLEREVDRSLELEVEGGRRILAIQGTVLRDARARPRGLVMVLSDVSDVRRVERIRKDFVDNVSHELKTPLTTLRGYMETLLDGAHEDPKTRVSFLRVVQKNADRMHRIVEDLLNLSRIESQGVQIERQPVRVQELLERVAEEMRVEADQRKVRLEIAAEPDASVVSGNAFLLERALTNLVDNAIKYAGQGKTVTMRARRDGTHLRLEVADQGPGIPSAHHGRLFERFYRIDRGRSRELGGTGLGLAIVKHVALAHGGEALVQSVTGAGSTFTIRVPGLVDGAEDDSGR